jgi:GTPase SAR1 family protein
MPNIAIIGTNGAGKTVFITVLARHLNERPTDDFVLDPEPRTFKYIETNWRTLNHWEWPGHTMAGNPVDLRWKFTGHGAGSGEMRVIDAPGHDIRSIFADDNVTALDAMPAAQQSLAEYCRAADIAVFVADLSDYIPKPDGRHIEDETILKSAMDFLRKHSRKYCLILTKEDLYRPFIVQEGGLESVAAKYLKSVYRSHLKSGVPCFPIACVNKTEPKVDGESIRTVPTPGFGSDGLEPFVEWLVASVGSVLPPPPPPPQPEPWPMCVAGLVAVLVFISNCTKTVVTGFIIKTRTNEFDPDSLLMAIFSFFVVWAVLAGIRGIVNFIRKRL